MDPHELQCLMSLLHANDPFRNAQANAGQNQDGDGGAPEEPEGDEPENEPEDDEPVDDEPVDDDLEDDDVENDPLDDLDHLDDIEYGDEEPEQQQ